MDCSQFKDYLYHFIDKEADGDLMKNIDNHLGECPLCSHEATKEEQLDCLIRQHFPKQQAPQHLREAIFANLKRVAQPRSPKRLVPVLGLSLGLLICILILIAQPGSRIVGDLVSEHTALISSQTSFDTLTNDPARLLTWLRQNVNFNVTVPQLSDSGFTVQGARLFQINKRKVVCIHYQRGMQTASIFMFEASNSKTFGTKKVVLDEKTFFFNSDRGYNTLAWFDKGIACIVVSDLTEAELVSLVNS